MSIALLTRSVSHDWNYTIHLRYTRPLFLTSPKNLAAYLRTRFVRFLVSLRTNTQHLYSERFAFVPELPMDREWTDEMLYKKYGITKDEIAFIESMIRPMGEGDE